METQSTEIIVSICCITYNHEKYLAKAIEGFLMQKTNFQFEIIIGEDYSTDATRNIIENYRLKHPSIQVITSESNVGAMQNEVRVQQLAKGKYVAMCEGDDYWTDPYKLQKQVDFLEKNHQYIICSHYSKVVNGQDQLIYQDANLIPLEYTYEDILNGNKGETRTCSLMIRNTHAIKQLRYQEWYSRCNAGDRFVKLFATAVTGKKIYVLPEIMSCYRVHSGGVWSLLNPKVRKRKMRSDFNIIIKNFKHTSNQKRIILKIYFTRYFLDDVKMLKINNIADTLMSLR